MLMVKGITGININIYLPLRYLLNIYPAKNEKNIGNRQTKLQLDTDKNHFYILNINRKGI